MSTARDSLRGLIPAAMKAFETGASLPLAAYAASFTGDTQTFKHSLQDGGDLIDLAVEESARLFSAQTGAALRRELEENFHALTANHHGVDFHPEFMQGNLLFAMNCRHAVPLFSCGGVPGNNVAYPRGILLGRGDPDNPDKPGMTWRPGRLPVLPNKNRHTLVSVQPPFGERPVRAALAALPRKRLTLNERETATRILHEIYLHPRVLGQASFREQASVMNALLWERLAAPECGLPPLAALDMQCLSGRLIARDIGRTHTLIHDLLLEPPLASAVREELDGERACWTTSDRGQARGTFLFWGVDEAGKALALAPSADFRELYAVGRPQWRIPLRPEALRDGLERLYLLPSLFLLFTAIALARGLLCAGGVFQSTYLPRMASGLAAALRRCGENALADRVTVLSPSCTGLLPLRLPWPDAASREKKAVGRAAGALDLAAGGGLSAPLWERVRHVLVADALAVSLPYHYEDLLGEKTDDAIMTALMRDAATASHLPMLPSAEPNSQCNGPEREKSSAAGGDSGDAYA